MDPAGTTDLLGKGTAQVILAVCVVALGIVAWKLATALIESYKARIGETREMLAQSSTDSKLVSDSLKDMKSTVDLALAALKGRS